LLQFCWGEHCMKLTCMEKAKSEWKNEVTYSYYIVFLFLFFFWHIQERRVQLSLFWKGL
jgi:hypothetical protein